MSKRGYGSSSLVGRRAGSSNDPRGGWGLEPGGHTRTRKKTSAQRAADKAARPETRAAIAAWNKRQRERLRSDGLSTQNGES